MKSDQEPNKIKEKPPNLNARESGIPIPINQSEHASIKWLFIEDVTDCPSLSCSFFPSYSPGGLEGNPGIVQCYIDDQDQLVYELCGLDFSKQPFMCTVKGVIDRDISGGEVAVCLDSKGNCAVFYTSRDKEGRLVLKYRLGILNTVEGEIIWSQIVTLNEYSQDTVITRLQASLRFLDGSSYVIITWEDRVNETITRCRGVGRLKTLKQMPTFIIAPKDGNFIFCTLALAPGCKVHVRSNHGIDFREFAGLENLLSFNGRFGKVWEYCVVGAPGRYPFDLGNSQAGGTNTPYSFAVSPLGVRQAFFRLKRGLLEDSTNFYLLPRFFLKKPEFLLTRELTHEQVTLRGSNEQEFNLEAGDDSKVFAVNGPSLRPISLSIIQPFVPIPPHEQIIVEPEQNQMGEEADIVIVD